MSGLRSPEMPSAGFVGSVLGHCARLTSLVVATAILTSLLSAPQIAAQTAPAQPNFYAVVIGVSEFENLAKDDWLQFADKDAQAFSNFITSPRGRAFPPENVFLMTDKDALSQAIRTKLGSTLAKKIKPEDTVYIFIATH